MLTRVKTFLTTLIILLFTVQCTEAQQFSGLRPFKKLVEFESQRFLLNTVYQVSHDRFNELQIEKIVEDYDMEYGFMFVIAFYTFESNSGMIISSFRETLIAPTMNEATKLVNLHLSEEEIVKISSMFGEAYMDSENKSDDKSLVRQFNDRLMFEFVFRDGYDPEIIFWIDNHHRHPVSATKWNTALRKYSKERQSKLKGK
jgi:hypothetical protein